MRFTPSESALHQAALEFYGFAMSFRAASTRPEMRDKRFRVRADAMVTVWYFRNSGGRSPLLNRILRFLWAQLRAADSTIVDMVHVAGSQCCCGHGLPRPPAKIFPESSVADRVEWRLELPWFLRIQALARCHFAADLFADRANHRLPVFFFAAICAGAAALSRRFRQQLASRRLVVLGTIRTSAAPFLRVARLPRARLVGGGLVSRLGGHFERPALIGRSGFRPGCGLCTPYPP